MAALPELLQKLSTQPAARGRQFEHICKWYLQNEPEYSAELRSVWLWDGWPGRWGADSGIDLVAETYDGRLWAIQAKAYSPDYSIRKADINSFLAESASNTFHFRLLLCTTNLVGHNARRTIDMQTKQTGIRLLADLEASAVDWPNTLEDMAPRPLRHKRPHAYQDEAIRNVVNGFAEHDRGQLLMACGTGKTLVGLWAAERLNSDRVLVLLPSLSLLAHSIRTWLANSSASFAFLPVCSDDTVRGQDRTTSKTSDLGLPVTTNPDEVAEFMRRSERLVVFATYQSSPVVAEACAAPNTPPFHLAIADEAHRCAGKVPREFATILEADRIQADRRLFMTATPKFFTGKLRREAKEYELELASMDVPVHFGPVFHKLSFSEAIDRNLLSDYRVAIVAVDNPTYRRYAQRGEFVTAEGITITDARELASHIATVKAMRQYHLRKLISFHNRVDRAQGFSTRLPEVAAWMPESDRPKGSINCAHVSGQMSAGSRDAILRRFQHADDQQRLLVSNARCLGEGVDVPTLDGVVFIDPRQSQIDIIQALGRAIRKSPEKRHGTIVLPVFVDEKETPQKAVESSAFKPIWDVLRALRAHDDMLGETLDRLRHALGRFQEPSTELPEKIHVEIPVSLDERFSKAMRLKLIESTTASWDYMFGLFERYVAEHGHPFVPARYKTPSGIRLGTWITAQRVNYRGKRLAPEQIRRFEAIEGWEWIPRQKAWKEAYGRMVEFVRANGDATIRQDYITPDGFRLGGWVATQREVYRKRRLSERRRMLLEKLPGWTWDATRTWRTGFKKFQEYARHNDAALIPRSFKTADGFALGNWVTAKKQDYNKGVLDPDIQHAMESVPGWEWSRDEAKWKHGIRRLRDFAQREGHTFVPAWHVEDGFRLGAWVRAQRTRHRKGRMEPEKCRALEVVPHWAWTWEGGENRVAPWEVGLRKLKDFAAAEGHTQVPRRYKSPDGFPLGPWIEELRKLRRRGHVRPEQEEELYSLPYWGWDPAEMAWRRAYGRLVQYIDGRDAGCVTGQTIAPDGFTLGSWVATQRKKYRDGILQDDRRRQLEQLPGWSWQVERRSRGPRHVAWDAAYAKVAAHCAAGGDASVPRAFTTDDGFKLGAWIGQQRKLFKEGHLQPSQVHRLESLPGWVWDVHGNAWNEGLRRLQRFAQDQGMDNLNGRTVVDGGFRLGLWVRAQRAAYRKGSLPDERASALADVPGWTWRPKSGQRKRSDTTWPTWFARLQGYVDENGTALVPRKYVTGAGERLGLWVGQQRQRYRSDSLTREQVQALECLPGWSWDPYEDAWRIAYGKLKDLIDRDGPEAVTLRSKTADGFCVGAWVQSQRRAIKARRLPADRVAALESLPGWPLRKQRGGRGGLSDSQRRTFNRGWDAHVTEVEAFAAEYGHARVPQRHTTPDGFALGAWVGSQRRAFKKGTLSPERRRRLEAIAGWEWHPYEGMWMRAFVHLRDAMAVLELADIGKEYVTGDNIRLGRWIRSQQKAYRDGSLSSERQKLLESLPKWKWSHRVTRKRRWGNFLRRLKAYRAQHGTAAMPIRYTEADGFPLGAMAGEARTQYRKGALSQPRIAELEQIPGWSWDVRIPSNYVRVDEAWEHFFSLLEDYVREHGDAMVPTAYQTESGERLGYWISGQRKARRNGELLSERERRLEALPGWQWAPRARSWDDAYSKLKELLQTIPMSDIRQTHVLPDGLKIGRWINDQRTDYKRGDLPPEQIKALEALPGWVWDQLEAQWDAAFEFLATYVRETGKTRLPMAYKVNGDGFSLGQWLRIQRKAHRNGKLSARRTRKIEQLPGWIWQ